MSSYHATHPSPYDDACPDCTGFAYVQEITTTYATRRKALRRQSGILAAATLLAIAITAVCVAVVR